MIFVLIGELSHLSNGFGLNLPDSFPLDSNGFTYTLEGSADALLGNINFPGGEFLARNTSAPVL